MIQVARGRLSKQIAFDIDIAEATVKVHRSRLMHKMKARSRPELSRIAGKLKLVPERPQHSRTRRIVFLTSRTRNCPLCCADSPAAHL